MNVNGKKTRLKAQQKCQHNEVRFISTTLHSAVQNVNWVSLELCYVLTPASTDHKNIRATCLTGILSL